MWYGVGCQFNKNVILSVDISGKCLPLMGGFFTFEKREEKEKKNKNTLHKSYNTRFLYASLSVMINNYELQSHRTSFE